MRPSTVRLPGVRPALIVAHPGHELRLHGWLEIARPIVLVLTDGSGASGRSRLRSTAGVLTATDAAPGPLFGRLTDRALYAMIVARDAALALRLVDELAAAILGHRVDYVVADALEGYNPAHDLCHVLVSAAVLQARRSGVRVPQLDFPLAAAPNASPSRRGSARLDLDDAALARKLAAARVYVGLGNEVERALALYGTEAFRVERLRRLGEPPCTVPPEDPPFYERYGASQVAGGQYAELLRYREHFAPLAAAVWRSAVEEEPWAASAS